MRRPRITCRHGTFALALAACAGDASPIPSGTIAITRVTVIDVTSGTRHADQTVVISGNRIAAVGPAAATRVPNSARTVDGRGAFLIPGLWDMHVHTTGPDAGALLPIYVAHGVTGIRDMGADLDEINTWRAAIEARSLVGPRIVAAGPILDGPLGQPMPAAHRRWRIEVTDTAHARRLVDSLSAAGADFIKVHERLAPPVYRAIADRARRRGLAIAGHVPTAVGPYAALDAGQRSMEHLVNVPFPCTDDEVHSLRPRSPLEAIFGRCDTEDQTPLVRRFAAASIWHTPTLSVQERVALGARQIPGDPGMRHVPAGVQQLLRGAGPFDLPPHPAELRLRLERLLDKRVQQVGELHRAGVRLMVGTDAPGVAPGWSVHRELALLVRGGLSPAEALRAATLEPVRYLGATDSLGAIGPARIADLVLLDADPLKDVRNVARIRAVVVNGRLVDERERRRLLRT